MPMYTVEWLQTIQCTVREVEAPDKQAAIRRVRDGYRGAGPMGMDTEPGDTIKNSYTATKESGDDD